MWDMLLTNLAFASLSVQAWGHAVSTLSSPRYIVSNPPMKDEGYRIPTVHESAVMARRILHLSSIGTLVTSFPTSHESRDRSQLHVDDADHASVLENRPNDVQGSPIGLMEYYADCEPSTGNPTLLAINIATPFRNYHAGSNISLGVRWWPAQTNHYQRSTDRRHDDDDDDDDDIPTPHTPAALPRFSLHGHLEVISKSTLATSAVPTCFLRAHPDSVYWQPGNEISHTSEYVRFVVEEVYWFGGFGDRARIGWLPIEDYRAVTKEEIEACRLPGEKNRGGRRGREPREAWKDWLIRKAGMTVQNPRL